MMDTKVNGNNEVNGNTYMKELEISSCEIFNYYVTIMNEYLLFFSQKEKENNKKRNDYILVNGLETLTHVFKLSILYTKNIDLTIKHTKNSILLYTQFTTQIEEDHNHDLNLTANSASLFVYKKTIYEFNKIESENKLESETIINNLEQLIMLYRTLFNVFMIDYNKNMDDITFKLINIFTELINQKNMNNEETLSKTIKNINLFIEHFPKYTDKSKNIYMYNYLYLFIVNHKQKDIHIESILNKKITLEYEEGLYCWSINKYIKWLIS